MFRLKSEQHDALIAIARETFPERLLEFLRRELPEICDIDDEDRTTRAIVRASRWGLYHELDVATFAVLAFVHGEEFDEEPWAKATLSRPDMLAADRIRRVYESAIRRRLIEGSALAGKELS